MKIKLYIVTYNREKDLNNTLESLFSTDIDHHLVDVYIVNNHSNFIINNKFSNRVKVLHNVFRPDFSKGHLSRNYNEIFIHGFRDLNHADCDILMHSHDDNSFDKNIFSRIIELHKKYTFITFSQGCGFCSYTPESIKNIGMWDERFCTIGYHEGDYFLRAIKYNNEKSSINDWVAAHRLHNKIDDHLAFKLPGTHMNTSHSESFKYYPICRKLFELKWPKWRDVEWRTNMQSDEIPNPSIPTYMMYPYFEKDILNIEEKYYPNIDINGRQFF